MSELDAITSVLQKVARRCRFARGLRGLWYGLLVGATVSLLILAVFHIYPLPVWWLMVAAIIPFPCLAAGFLIGAWKCPPLIQVAQWVDDRQRLKERLSTALEFAPEEKSRWRDLIITDAAHQLSAIDARRLVPFRLPRVTRWAVITLALGAGLGFIPEYRSKSLLQQQAEQANIKEVGQQLAMLTRRNLEQRAPVLDTTQKSLESVAQLGDQLAKQKLTRADALQQLANVAEKIKSQAESLTKDPPLKTLSREARNTGGNQTQEGLQKQIDSLQKQIGNPAAPDALDKLQRDLQKLQQGAKGMNEQTPVSADEKQKMSDALSAVARQAQALGLQLPELDQAMAALAANQTDLFMKDLDQAVQDLEKLQDMSKTLAQLQQQMEQMGRDLAEQLERGQPEAAEETLRKMSQALTAANLAPESLKKILDEVSKAVDPAGNYDKVADHLKQGLQQMKSGNKEGASKSLAAAADELKKMMQQMADANQLNEALERLQQASNCVGKCQGWGMGVRPGYKPGGKPGTGVGTWAEENEDWSGGWANGWDNSNVKRPDLDPRGLTDRGPGEVSPDLTPTKVKGQMSPGSQMPSITLKGVSIKGQSRVSYEEAAAAAQSDAENALSQEKVPRAYQNAVRDYFDDLK